MLAGLKVDGIAAFQIVVGAVGYQFDSESYLTSIETKMEMHCFPLARVLRIMANNGVEVLSIEPDDWACDFGLSMTVIGRKV